MNPVYENINPNPGSSFYCAFETYCNEPFWHIHPEYELVYVDSGSATRHIGSSISKYTDGDLLLIGSNVPHSSMGNIQNTDNWEVVVQMSTDFVEEQISGFPEFKVLKAMFDRSKHGISFGKRIKEEIAPLLREVVKADPFDKLVGLLKILHKLAKTTEYELLNAKTAIIETNSKDYHRINRINEFVVQHFKRNIPLKEMAELCGLTETSFSRFFKKTTGKTFVAFLAEYRVQKASSLLSYRQLNIAEVMEQAGFIDPAHFSRVFKQYTDYSPREYRRLIHGRK